MDQDLSLKSHSNPKNKKIWNLINILNLIFHSSLRIRIDMVDYLPCTRMCLRISQELEMKRYPCSQNNSQSGLTRVQRIPKIKWWETILYQCFQSSTLCWRGRQVKILYRIRLGIRYRQQRSLSSWDRVSINNKIGKPMGLRQSNLNGPKTQGRKILDSWQQWIKLKADW